MPSFWDKVKRNADAAREELAKRASRFQQSCLPRRCSRRRRPHRLSRRENRRQRKSMARSASSTRTRRWLAGRPTKKATLFRDYATKAADQFAKIQLSGKISAQKSNPEAATTLIELALALANADGEFAQKEKDVVVRICGYLNLDSSHYV